MKDECGGHKDRAQQHDQQRRRAIAHVEAREIQPAGGAAVGKAHPAGEQRARAAFGAETEKGGLADRGPPLWCVRVIRHNQWTGAPQPPQT